jgi:hypothetical protein
VTPRDPPLKGRGKEGRGGGKSREGKEGEGRGGVREYGRKGRGRTGEEEGKREGGEGMIRNDRPFPRQKILDPPLRKFHIQLRFHSPLT